MAIRSSSNTSWRWMTIGSRGSGSMRKWALPKTVAPPAISAFWPSGLMKAPTQHSRFSDARDVRACLWVISCYLLAQCSSSYQACSTQLESEKLLQPPSVFILQQDRGSSQSLQARSRMLIGLAIPWVIVRTQGRVPCCSGSLHC